MAKKTLNEAVIRRFQKLANVAPINEMYHMRDDDEVMEMGAEEAPEEAEMDMDAEEAGVDGDLELTDDEAQAIIDLGSKLQAAMGDMGGMEDMEMGAEEAPEMDMEAGAEMDAEEELMEALRGINYKPSKNEVVNEVAKRVAKRLQAAKLHESSN